jgi:hypothetical protein
MYANGYANQRLLPRRSQPKIRAQAVDRSACGVVGGVAVHVAGNRDGGSFTLLFMSGQELSICLEKCL